MGRPWTAVLLLLLLAVAGGVLWLVRDGEPTSGDVAVLRSADAEPPQNRVRIAATPAAMPEAIAPTGTVAVGGGAVGAADRAAPAPAQAIDPDTEWSIVDVIDLDGHAVADALIEVWRSEQHIALREPVVFWTDAAGRCGLRAWKTMVFVASKGETASGVMGNNSPDQKLALPLVERPDAVQLIEAETVQEVAQPVPVAPADPLTLPPVSPGKAWDGLFKAADDLAFGAITQEGLVNLAFDLLAQLPADATPQYSYGFAVFDLLESPGQGKVRLSVKLDTTLDASERATGTIAFTIAATLDTRPGAYTGNVNDRSTSTKLDISVSTDEHDALKGVFAVSQNLVGGSPELWSQMSGAGQPVVIGGVFSITGDSATWRPISVEAAGTEDEPMFAHHRRDAFERSGELADPRTQLLNDVLVSRRRSVLR